MSIFGSIVSKIFGHAQASPAPSSPSTSTAGSSPGGAPSTSSASTSGTTTTSFNNPPSNPTAPGASASSPQPAANSNQSVDVASILDGLSKNNSQKLDWRHSIVDLMKLLDLDSSQSARQELAKELHYSGSSSDSAAMNIWLHKQVMQKLAENGGKVPDELK